MDEAIRKRRLEKMIGILKSWKGPKPDYDNLDFSRYNQTEEEYQEEQRQWMENRRKNKDTQNDYD